MTNAQLPITLWMWLAAVAPLLIILVLLVGLRWKAGMAGSIGYFVAVLSAFFLYETSGRQIALASVKGVWDAIFIAYVIVPALLLYQISKEAGAFAALQRGIQSYTPNRLLQILAFGWVFSSFLQGITGFGAPIAVTAPLLVAVGVQPLWAVVIPLIGHVWAKTFGTLAVAWEGLLLVTTVPQQQTAIVTAIMLLVANVLAGFAIAWFYGKGAGVREALPAIGVIAAIHGIGQLVLAPIVPTLANVIPGSLGVAAVLWLARTGWYNKESEVQDSPILEGQGSKERRSEPGTGAGAKPTPEEAGAEDATRKGRAAGERPMSMLHAFAPYGILVAVTVIALLVPPIERALSAFEVGLPFPRIETGLGVVTEAEAAYSAFSPWTHAGTFLLAAAIFAYVLYRVGGHIDRKMLDDVIVRTLKQSIPSVMALIVLVPLAKVLEESGQILELALGIAQVSGGTMYAFVAPFIGGLGAFMSSSNLSSNILFGPLQERTATALALAQSVILAAQTSGAAIANAIAPANALLGVGAVGATGQSGAVIRRAMGFTVVALALTGLIAVLATLYIGPGAIAPGAGR